MLKCASLTDIDIKETLLNNIIIVGGNTLLPGYTERMEKELSLYGPQNAKIKTYSYVLPFERKFSSWIGNSILGATGSFQNMWISKREYEEDGASVLERKCH